MDEMIGRVPQYDVFADEFLDHAQEGFANAHDDRPACLALLGQVAGKHVLDAARGPGLYAAELVRRGARVTGFDQSPRWRLHTVICVQVGQNRVPKRMEATMGWTVEQAQKHSVIAETPKGRGLTATIKVTVRDSGVTEVNGTPVWAAHHETGVAEAIAALLVEFYKKVDKRRRDLADQ